VGADGVWSALSPTAALGYSPYGEPDMVVTSIASTPRGAMFGIATTEAGESVLASLDAATGIATPLATAVASRTRLSCKCRALPRLLRAAPPRHV
jgi:hypothetical protein